MVSVYVFVLEAYIYSGERMTCCFMKLQ